MRLPFAIVFAAGLVGCTPPPPPPPPAVAAYVPPGPTAPTQHAPICARPPEKAAFDMNGLKSELMVIAVSCHTPDRYNEFVSRFKGDLNSGEKALNTFFSRAYGRRAQQEHDDYITQLANAQSELGIHQGTAFCALSTSMFDDVLALKRSTPEDLPRFAATKPIQQSLAVDECPDSPAPASAASKTSKPVASSAAKKP